MLRAVKQGELGDLAELVEHDPCLLLQRSELASSTIMTAVQIASAEGRTVILQYLLHQLETAAGVHAKEAMLRVVNSRNSRQQTPLIMAASAGHLAAVNILLDMGANVWAVDNLGGRCALHYAARSNHPDVIMTLLDAAAQQPRPGTVPAHVGCRYVDARTQYGLTPLHFAIRGHGMEAAAALLSRGALLSLPSMFDGEWMDCPRGTTPLHLAARLGQQELALLILQQYVDRRASSGGVDPRFLKDVEEALPCHVAASRHFDQLAHLLCPSTPIAAALSGTTVHLMLGPPRLARLAAAALHDKLGNALQACSQPPPSEQEDEEVAGDVGTSREGSAPSTSSSCCPVCLDSPGAAAVVLQPCGHQVCHPCCSSLWELDDQEMLQCPLCRAAVGDITRAPL